MKLEQKASEGLEKDGRKANRKLAPMWMAPVILAVPEWHALFRDLTGIQFQPVVFSFCAGINIISRSEDRKIGAR